MHDRVEPSEKPWLADKEICRQLCILCGSKRTRTVAVTRHRWEPGRVRDPKSGECFDTESAWAFIRECLEAGAEVEVIELDHPRGKRGYVLFGQGTGGDRIYMKLQFGGQNVIGRSFHISNEKSRER